METFTGLGTATDSALTAVGLVSIEAVKAEAAGMDGTKAQKQCCFAVARTARAVASVVVVAVR